MYLGNSYLTTLIIGGGWDTPAHIKSGGIKLDLVQQEGVRRAMWDMTYVTSGDLGTKQGYAVYRLNDTNIYRFHVHIKNPRKGLIKRGDIAFDFYSGSYLHIHDKVGGYTSNVQTYLEWLQYLDPSVKITTNFGSSKYTGLNKGAKLPTLSGNDMNWNTQFTNDAKKWMAIGRPDLQDFLNKGGDFTVQFNKYGYADFMTKLGWASLKDANLDEVVLLFSNGGDPIDWINNWGRKTFPGGLLNLQKPKLESDDLPSDVTKGLENIKTISTNLLNKY